MFVIYDEEKQKVPIYVWRNSIEELEESCLEQAINAANHPAVFHHVALAPDCHTGYGLPVGGICALEKAVSPNFVGVDIACGVLAYKTPLKVDDIKDHLHTIVSQIKRDIPMGFNHQKDLNKWKSVAEKLVFTYKTKCNLENIEPNQNINVDVVSSSIGSLGGGNHFLELQKDEEDNVWIMIHSGSRNIGKKVADKFHKKAKELCKQWHVNLPNDDTAFLPVETNEGQAYLADMNFCVEFSYMNRICMLHDIIYAINRSVPHSDFNGILNNINNYNQLDIINIHHNYVAIEHAYGANVWVHRKGATSAKRNEIGIIPGNMADKSYIVQGKGNEKSFQSCSHGAGRTMSRKKAKQELSMDEFKEKMKDIVSLDVKKDNLDESPMAYKDINEVMNLQEDLVDIIYVLTPIANCKG